MQLTWTTLLAQYGQQHNGLFFGGNDDRFDGQLILNRREKSPLLVMLRQVQSGRYASNQLTAPLLSRSSAIRSCARPWPARPASSCGSVPTPVGRAGIWWRWTGRISTPA